MQPNQVQGQQPAANPPAMAPGLIPFGIPTASNQGQHYYGHSNVGSTYFGAEGFGLPTHPPVYPLADLAPPVAHSGLNQPQMSYQASAHNFSLMPTGGPPSETANYSATQALDQSGATGPISVSSSANPSSYQHSLFDNISASGHSHVNSSSNAEAPPSNAWAVPATTSNAVLSAWLRKNPHTLSLSQLNQELSADRYHKEWMNWERELIVMFWVGPEARAHKVCIAMGAQKSPGPSDQFSPDWEAV
jgi:hypothetical protein